MILTYSITLTLIDARGPLIRTCLYTGVPAFPSVCPAAAIVMNSRICRINQPLSILMTVILSFTSYQCSKKKEILNFSRLSHISDKWTHLFHDLLKIILIFCTMLLMKTFVCFERQWIVTKIMYKFILFSKPNQSRSISIHNAQNSNSE